MKDQHDGWVLDIAERPRSLDEAWAAAEAALPDSMWFDLEKRSATGYNAVAFSRSTGHATRYARADTPAAALLALAVKLREEG